MEFRLSRHAFCEFRAPVVAPVVCPNQGSPNAAHFAPPASRSRRRAQLWRACLQHQQHGAGARDHGGGGRDRCAGHHPGEPRRAQLCQRHHAPPHDGCGDGDLSAYSGVRTPRPRQRAGDLHDGDPGRLHLGDDGRVAQGRRQDACRLGLQRRRHQGRHRHGPSRRHLGRRRIGRPRLARDRQGRQGGWPRRGGNAQPRPAPDQSGRSREVRQGDQGRRAGHRDGHQPRRLQIQPQARRRHPRDARDRGDPPQAAEPCTW